MKIKKAKSMTIKKGGDSAGGAAIADRFKLEPDAGSGAAAGGAKAGTVSRKAALCALIAGFISLALVGSLTLVILFHWLFLMPA